jgi:hypothetical protein
MGLIPQSYPYGMATIGYERQACLRVESGLQERFIGLAYLFSKKASNR